MVIGKDNSHECSVPHGDSPARECPSSWYTCYRSDVKSQRILNLFEHEAEWGRNTSAVECSHQMTRWARRYAKSESSRRLELVRSERGEIVAPDSQQRNTLWFYKDPRIYYLTKIKRFSTIQGDWLTLYTFTSYIRSRYRYL